MTIDFEPRLVPPALPTPSSVYDDVLDNDVFRRADLIPTRSKPDATYSPVRHNGESSMCCKALHATTPHHLNPALCLLHHRTGAANAVVHGKKPQTPNLDSIDDSKSSRSQAGPKQLPTPPDTPEDDAALISNDSTSEPGIAASTNSCSPKAAFDRNLSQAALYVSTRSSIASTHREHHIVNGDVLHTEDSFRTPTRGMITSSRTSSNRTVIKVPIATAKHDGDEHLCYSSIESVKIGAKRSTNTPHQILEHGYPDIVEHSAIAATTSSAPSSGDELLEQIANEWQKSAPKRLPSVEVSLGSSHTNGGSNHGIVDPNEYFKCIEAAARSEKQPISQELQGAGRASNLKGSQPARPYTKTVAHPVTEDPMMVSTNVQAFTNYLQEFLRTHGDKPHLTNEENSPHVATGPQLSDPQQSKHNTPSLRHPAPHSLIGDSPSANTGRSPTVPIDNDEGGGCLLEPSVRVDPVAVSVRSTAEVSVRKIPAKDQVIQAMFKAQVLEAAAYGAKFSSIRIDEIVTKESKFDRMLRKLQAKKLLGDASGRDIHIFVDMSNIFIGFQETSKALRGIPSTYRAKFAPFSFEHLAYILERGRTVVKRKLTGSVRRAAQMTSLPSHLVQAKAQGYDTTIFVQVEKLDTSQALVGSSNSPSTSSDEGNSSSGRPVLVCTKLGEQGVDENLHLGMLKSLLDAEEPGTMVLATGDARPAEFSEGFAHFAIKALKKGWHLEVVSWKKSLSSEWRKSPFKDTYASQVRLIPLDDFFDEIQADWDQAASR